VKKEIRCRLAQSEQDFNGWNSFLAQSKISPISQTKEWGNLKKISNWKSYILILEQGNVILGGIMILKRNIPFLNKSIFYAPRGPVVDFHNKDLLSILINKVRFLAQNHQAIVLKIDPEIEEDDELAKENLYSLDFKFINKQIQPRATFFVDLNRDLDDILMSFKSKHRYNIRLSKRKDIEVEMMTNQKGIDIFYDILEETANRDSFIIHPKIYYEKVVDYLKKGDMIKIFIAFYHKKPLAGVYIFCFGNKIWYMYGASSAEHRNRMPNHAIHWQVIKWAKNNNYKTYDLWGIPVKPRPEHPLYGVYRFKKGFKGEKKVFIGMHDLIFKPFWYKFFNKSLNTYTKLRSLIKKGKISDSLKE